MTPRDFIFDTPLYAWVKIDENFLKALANDGNLQCPPKFDGYNPVSNCDSTYVLNSGFKFSPLREDSTVMHDEFVYLHFACSRRGDEMLIMVQTDFEKMQIRKIGQYPSVADIHIGMVKQYSKIAKKEDLRELTKAIGLAANGVGIGSFVYLRRIFENLVFEASKKLIDEGTVKKEEFATARMDEKIAMLKEELPEFLYENKHIYGIISKGIHELTEEECLSMFDILRGSIEMILDDKLVKHQKEQKREELKNRLSKIASELKK